MSKDGVNDGIGELGMILHLSLFFFNFSHRRWSALRHQKHYDNDHVLRSGTRDTQSRPSIQERVQCNACLICHSLQEEPDAC